eukprot:1149165-Pelagomonas_calceolata.AAC.9
MVIFLYQPARAAQNSDFGGRGKDNLAIPACMGCLARMRLERLCWINQRALRKDPTLLSNRLPGSKRKCKDKS